MLVEGVHVDLDRDPPADAGWKAVVANVSDIAAMGGRPLHLVAAVVVPEDAGVLDEVGRGLAEAAAAHDCRLVGGDLSTGPALVVAVAVTGTVDPPGSPVLRSGARPGDTIWVTGPLGRAAAAGWAERPQARVAEGTAARLAGATAMIDVSDGLGADLGHLAGASGVGVALTHVPVAPGATLDQALGGGEDFELVYTLPPGASGPGERIGRCTGDPGERRLGDGDLPPVGWEHRWP